MSNKRARAPSAYFIFCDEHRAQVQLELNQQQTDGTKVAVCAVAKALGQRWKELSEEARARYKEQAAAHAVELAAAAAAAQEAAGEGPDADPDAAAEAAAGSSKSSAAGFPVAVLKRIMHADPDVSRASSDAVWAVGKAVELFVVALADKCHSAARSRKQSVVKMQDFVTVVRTDKRLCQAGLKDIAAGVQRAAEAAAAAAATAPPKPAPAKRAATGAAGAAATAGGAAAGDEDAGQEADVAAGGAAAAEGAAAEAAAAEDEVGGRDQAAKRARTDGQGSSKGGKKANAAAAAAKSSHRITTFFVKQLEVAASD